MKKRKLIIISLLVLLIVLVGLVIILKEIKKENNKKIELGNSIYEEIHDLYFSGSKLEYVYDETRNRVYKEFDDTKYYEISNYEIFDLIASESKDRLMKIFDIKKEEGKYYIADFGRGISNYYGTKLKISKKSKEKIEFKAISEFCLNSEIISLEECDKEDYYTIDKPFIIIKEDNKWKVLEYTSVFQFSDREFK